MVFAPPKYKTVVSGGFETPGDALSSPGVVTLLGS
jgi:hypothetical protein